MGVWERDRGGREREENGQEEKRRGGEGNEWEVPQAILISPDVGVLE